jgi:hypothetical protein
MISSLDELGTWMVEKSTQMFNNGLETAAKYHDIMAEAYRKVEQPFTASEHESFAIDIRSLKKETKVA